MTNEIALQDLQSHIALHPNFSYLDTLENRNLSIAKDKKISWLEDSDNTKENEIGTVVVTNFHGDNATVYYMICKKTADNGIEVTKYHEPFEVSDDELNYLLWQYCKSKNIEYPYK